MDCERNDLLIGLLEDALDPGERVAVEAHLEGCEPCREVVRAYRDAAGALAALEPPAPSEEGAARAYAAVLAAMEADGHAAPRAEGGGPPAGGRLLRLGPLLAAAACLLVGVSLILAPVAFEGQSAQAPAASAAGAERAPAASEAVGAREDEAQLAESAFAADEAPSARRQRAEAAGELEAKGAEAAEALAAAAEATEAAAAGASRRPPAANEPVLPQGGPGDDSPPASGEPAPSAPPPPAPAADGGELTRSAYARRGAAGAEADADAPAEEAEVGLAYAADALDAAELDEGDGPTELTEAELAEAPAGVGDEAPPAPGAFAGAAAPLGDAEGRAQLGGGAPAAAWRVTSPDGLRLYVLRDAQGLTYADLPAVGDGAEPPEATRAQRARPRASQVASALIRARARDLRVAEELLAILRLELSPPPAAAKATDRDPPASSTVAVRALFLALGVRVAGDEPGDELRARLERLTAIHQGVKLRLRAPDLELEAAEPAEAR